MHLLTRYRRGMCTSSPFTINVHTFGCGTLLLHTLSNLNDSVFKLWYWRSISQKINYHHSLFYAKAKPATIFLDGTICFVNLVRKISIFMGWVEMHLCLTHQDALGVWAADPGRDVPVTAAPAVAVPVTAQRRSGIFIWYIKWCLIIKS